MSLQIVTPPAAEPLTVAEAKARLRVEHAEDDALVAQLIAAARERVESFTGRALVTRRLRERRDGWTRAGSPAGPAGAFRLALGPVTAVHHVKVYADDDAETTLAPNTYYLDAASAPARIALRGGALWPPPGRRIDGIEIEYDAGYGESPSAAPRPLVEAAALLVAELYEHRLSSERPGEVALPAAVHGLLAPFARARL